jgi:hypothetical protein
MKHHKLESEQRQEQAAEQHQKQGPPVREFATAEELLRYDAAQTTVPPGIAHKLQRSVDGLPRPDAKPAWWKRFFGGNP